MKDSSDYWSLYTIHYKQGKLDIIIIIYVDDIILMSTDETTLLRA